MRVLFDRGPDGSAAEFDVPHQIIEAWEPEDIPAAFEAMKAAEGWLVGYCSYELGYALEPRLLPLMPKNRKLPLLRFGVYDRPQPAVMPEADGTIGDLASLWDAPKHADAIGKLRDYIAAGDIYQANLTFPITTTVDGSPEGIYGALAARQAVGHSALILQDGPAILSRSPELFFRIKDGMIETAPMKGTMPRGKTQEEDAANKAFLSTDEKNRAENLMIVDLLRNDISRISVAGTVKVPKLFHVETYATVHQMISRVEARLMDDVTFPDILQALFPCGSITGAPKLRAMEIIEELETAPREVYCGSIGWFAPDGRAEFNVAIRTLMVDGDQATLNVGGGIVWDSTPASEYEEALWKARFAQIDPKTSS